MHNIKLIIAYDGSTFLGWQKTRMGPSIEASLQRAIEQILQHPVSLQAASRTDAGVHAEGQVVNFLTSKSLNLSPFRISLNSLLPKAIVVLEIEEMPAPFHPTLDCISKEYVYYVCYGPTQLPQHRLYSWHVPALLDLTAIRQAALLLQGTHHFGAFCNTKKNAHYADFTREVYQIDCIEIPPSRLYFCIQGNHFLYKMVRNLVGTLIDIGRGKLTTADIPLILQSAQRPRAGVTAPAHGLFLKQIFYR